MKSGVDDLDPNRTSIIRFNITDFQKSFILLQVDFMQPENLSPTYLQQDFLIVHFVEPLFFISETLNVLASNTVIQHSIPTQVGNVRAAQMAQLTSTVASGMNAIATTNLIVNLVLSFGLKYLWNFVNLLQFLVFIPKWRIKIPSNALIVL